MGVDRRWIAMSAEAAAAAPSYSAPDRAPKTRQGSVGPVLRSPAWGVRSPGMTTKRARSPGAPPSTSSPRGAYDGRTPRSPTVASNRPKSPRMGGATSADAKAGEASKFERDLFQAIEILHAKRDMRRLTGIMISNQDAEFPSDEITQSFSWKGDNTAQNAVYLGVQQQYLFWKHTWAHYDEDEQMAEGLPTFNFHLISMLSAAMDTYWFSDNQQLQLFDWLRDMVSGAELLPLRSANEKLHADNISCKKRMYEYEAKLKSMKASSGPMTQINMALVACIVLLAAMIGHIFTVHTMPKK